MNINNYRKHSALSRVISHAGRAGKHLAVIALLHSASSVAAEYTVDEYDLANELLLFEELPQVVTAARKPQNISEAASTIDVITSEDIQRSGARKLSELLERLPGIYTPQAHNGLDMLWIRGVGRRHNDNALLMIDGVPYRTLYFSNFPINEQIPLEDIDHIEVIRGPGSALYGTNAFTGVVNILTKDALEASNGQVATSYGSWDTNYHHAILGHTFQGGEVVLFGKVFNSDGHAAVSNDEGLPTNETLESNNEALSIKLSYGAWDFGVRYTNAELNDFTAVSDDEEGGISKREHILTRVGFQQEFSEHFTLQMTAYHNIFNLSKLRNGVDEDGVFVGQTDTQQDSTVTGLDILGTSVLSDQHTLLFGVSGEIGRLDQAFSRTRESLDEPFEFIEWASASGGDTPESISDSSWGAYIEDEFRASDKWLVTAGLRYDSFEAFDSSFSPRLSIVYLSSKSTTYKFRYGEAFRAPTFEELYRRSEDGEAEGNPELKPQAIQTYELEVSHRVTPRHRLNATAFHTEFEDFIAVFGDDDFENLEKRTFYGFETGLSGHFTQDLSYFLNYSLTVGKQGNEEIGSIPEQLGNLGFTYSGFKYLDVSPHLRWVDSRARPANYQQDVDPDDQQNLLAGYTEVNLTLRTKNTRGPFDASLSIRNLFDETYYTPGEKTEDFDIRQAGQMVTLKVAYQW